MLHILIRIDHISTILTAIIVLINTYYINPDREYLTFYRNYQLKHNVKFQRQSYTNHIQSGVQQTYKFIHSFM